MPDTIAGPEMGYHPALETKHIELLTAFNEDLRQYGVTENILEVVSWGSDAGDWAINSKLGVFIATSQPEWLVPSAPNLPPTN